MVKTRRELHRIPEESGKEFLTQGYICNFLSARGIPYRTIATGVVCDFIGKDAERVIALRADIDALPIREKTDVPYQSENGFMHACGHDGHTAVLLTVCDILSAYPPCCTVRAIFQFGEEGQAGAVTMTAGGAVQDVSEIYALHVDPSLCAGGFSTKAGPMMAGAAELTVRFMGKSAHCAEPEKGTDALKPLAELMAKAGSLVSENTLLHIGKVKGGSAKNIVADWAETEATLRYFEKADYTKAMQNLSVFLKETDKRFGTKHTLSVDVVYPPVINAEEAVKRVKAVCPAVKDAPVRYTAEDFAFYAEKIPACLVWLGTQTESYSAPLHSDTFGFDEEALTAGAELFLRLIDSQKEPVL